jgi:aminoglycoside 3-N-acetyltransferase
MIFLQRSGKVSFNVILEKSDLIRAIRRVGIRAGDIVVAHTTLSGFGYVRGGADTVIDALRAVIGPKGTLAVPTHSLNWIGKPPYDSAHSPTRLGAVPVAFLRRPEAIRSLHPTHSVAVIGPVARQLVQGHDHTCPALGQEGFWGHFVRAGGKVILMCPLGANTLLHAVDLWAGAPAPSVMAHRIENGRRIEFVEPALPWHTTSFPRIYAALFRKHLIRAAPLGKGKIHSLRAEDAIEVGLPIVRRNPLLVTETGCTCWYCTYVRQQVAPKRRSAR